MRSFRLIPQYTTMEQKCTKVVLRGIEQVGHYKICEIGRSVRQFASVISKEINGMRSVGPNY